MSIPIVNDHSAIGRRLREIEAGDVKLPVGIYVMLPDERPSDSALKGCDTIFSLQSDGRIVLHFCYHREIVAQRVTTMLDWLANLCPSSRLNTDIGRRANFEITLAERDCERLIRLLTRLRRPML